MVLATFAVIAASAQVAAAANSPPPPRDPSNPYADDQLVPREMMRQYRERQRREAERGSDAAKAERRASRSKYRDKSRHEALAIARAKFERLLGTPAWTGVDLEPGQKVKQYLTDFQALIDVSEKPGDTALVESTLPLRNEQSEATDLALEPSGAGFAPRAPAVDVTLPADVADGVELAGGQLTVAPVTDAGTDAIETDDKVFYANALTDTDVLVMPTARGFETFHQLRSAESPERLAFDVEVPGGAALRFGEQQGSAPGDRGIEVVSPGGKVIARISPPVAYGADEEPVEVDYSIAGTRLTMTVPHRDRDVAYPVMVDPDFQAEEWSWAGGNRDTHNWVYAAAGGCSGWNRYFGQGFWTYGHILYGANGNQSCGVEEWAEWHWQAPGMSYIYRAEFLNQNHPFRNDCIVNALWNPWAANWDGGWVWLHCGDLWNHSRGHCPVSNDCNMNNGAPSNVAVWKVQNGWWGGWRQYGPWAELGGAAVYVRDRDNPVIDRTGHNTDGRWYRSGTMTVAPKAHDDGLGMNKFQLTIPNFIDDYRRHPCLRTRCPWEWQLPNDGQGIFSYNIADIPNGINTVTLNARDALDKITPASWSLNVDDEQPWLNVYGELREAVYAAPWAGAKTLWINSQDNQSSPYNGAPSTARSGITAVEIYVDGVKAWTHDQSCYANCRLDTKWTYDSNRYSRGKHSIRVVARDGAGNTFSSSTWYVTSSPVLSDADEKFPPYDEELGEPWPTGTGEQWCDPHPEFTYTYCGEQDATEATEVAAAAEPPLAPTDPASGGAPRIKAGSANWAFHQPNWRSFTTPRAPTSEYDGYPEGHSCRNERAGLNSDPRFMRLGVRKVRVQIPWDVIFNAEGINRSYGIYHPDGKLIQYEVEQRPDVLYEIDQFMHEARQRGYEILVSFISTRVLSVIDPVTKEPLREFGTSLDMRFDKHVLPSTKTYRREVERIINRYRGGWIDLCGRQRPGIPQAQLSYFTAWNEPNHESQPPSGQLSLPHVKDQDGRGDTKAARKERWKQGAWRAAEYYNALRTLCKTSATFRCSVLAGDFIDTGDLPWYLKYYNDPASSRGIASRPKLWALHPYVAAAYWGTDKQPIGDQRLKDFMDATDSISGIGNSRMWFTEQGPLYAGTLGNHNDWNNGNSKMVRLLNFTEKYQRVTRFYYYAMHGNYETHKSKQDPCEVEQDPAADPVQPRNFQHDSGMVDPSTEREDACNNIRINPATGERSWTAEEQLRPAYCTYGKMTNPGEFAGTAWPNCRADTNPVGPG